MTFSERQYSAVYEPRAPRPARHVDMVVCSAAYYLLALVLCWIRPAGPGSWIRSIEAQALRSILQGCD